MNQIREKCLLDSTVTIVLLGKCTHSRRHVDWEIKSSLRQGASAPNGLIGIVLPSQGRGAFLPPLVLRTTGSTTATIAMPDTIVIQRPKTN